MEQPHSLTPAPHPKWPQQLMSHPMPSLVTLVRGQASLDEDDMWEDDFQTPHTPVRRIVWRENNGHGDPAEGRPESSRGSQGW